VAMPAGPSHLPLPPAPLRQPTPPRRQLRPGPSRQRVRAVDVRSVARVSILLYLSLVLVATVLGVVVYLLAGLTGVVGSTERFIQSLFGFASFRFLGLELLAALVAAGVVLALVGTAVNVAAAVLYNRLARNGGGLQVTLDGPVQPPPV
jgi:hypothetical protein